MDKPIWCFKGEPSFDWEYVAYHMDHNLAFKGQLSFDWKYVAYHIDHNLALKGQLSFGQKYVAVHLFCETFFYLRFLPALWTHVQDVSCECDKAFS